MVLPPQRGAQPRLEPLQRARRQTVIIQSDDPAYMPPTQAQVAEVAEMVQKIPEQVYATLSELSSTGLPQYGTEPSTRRLAKQRFDKLAAEWRSGVAFSSSLLEMATHPAYQQIIGMGKSAVLFILGELAQTPDHWFWALKAITGEDPVPDADRGNLERMTQAWLVWGARHGYQF